MSWQRLLGSLDRLPTEGSWKTGTPPPWRAPTVLAPWSGRCSADDWPRVRASAFLAGYQAALRALWPAAPEGLGALCVTEKRSVRPADLQTRLEGLVLHGQKDFVTAGDSASSVAGGRPRRGTGAAAATVDDGGPGRRPGARLEALPALPLMPDVPHSRLLLDGAHCERLPGDGWDDYVRPFRLLEDVHAGGAGRLALWGRP